jgi:hypothetical protein
MSQVVRSVVLLSLVAVPGILAAQMPSPLNFYSGTWVIVPGSAVGRVQGQPPALVVNFETSSDALVVKKSGLPYERYTLDGTTTRLNVNLTGSLRLDDSGMTLTTRRAPGDVTGNVNRTVETITDRYVLNGSNLVLTRTLHYGRSQAAAGNTTEYRWEVRYTREQR